MYGQLEVAAKGMKKRSRDDPKANLRVGVEWREEVRKAGRQACFYALRKARWSLGRSRHVRAQVRDLGVAFTSKRAFEIFAANRRHWNLLEASLVACEDSWCCD